MIVAGTKYGKVRGAKGARAGQTPEGVPSLFIPTITGTRKRLALRDWYWQEIREGGFLHEYLRQEKARTPAMLRQVARMMDGFAQNNRSDLRRLCTIPARLYHRWKAEDEHFFEDDNNLRSLKRDNPDAAVFVGPRSARRKR